MKKELIGLSKEELTEGEKFVVKYRNSHGYIVSYIEYSICKDAVDEVYIAPLLQTDLALKNISEMLKENNIDVRIMKGVKANEESFKSLSNNSPDIIHLATHGFVITTNDKYIKNSAVSKMTPYSVKEGYMLLSGVLMSGANNAWSGNFDLYNVEDGILTSDEISRLDLSKTKLVVLSACETAKGIIDTVDGVIGLQHAFKRAGVGSIVMSLWKVPDVSTAMLMKYFYSFLLNGIERHEALKLAMKEIRKTYNDPYYWAGFIILD